MKKVRIKIVESNTCDPCAAAGKYPAEPRFSADRHMAKMAARDKHMHTGDCEKPPVDYKNATNGQESRMHRTTLAHLVADVKVLLDLVKDEDDLPEWLETKITKAGDYMSSAARYVAGNIARDQGQLEEQVINITAELVQGLIDNLNVSALDSEALSSLYATLSGLSNAQSS